MLTSGREKSRISQYVLLARCSTQSSRARSSSAAKDKHRWRSCGTFHRRSVRKQPPPSRLIGNENRAKFPKCSPRAKHAVAEENQMNHGAGNYLIKHLRRYFLRDNRVCILGPQCWQTIRSIRKAPLRRFIKRKKNIEDTYAMAVRSKRAGQAALG